MKRRVLFQSAVDANLAAAAAAAPPLAVLDDAEDEVIVDGSSSHDPPLEDEVLVVGGKEEHHALEGGDNPNEAFAKGQKFRVVGTGRIGSAVKMGNKWINCGWYAPVNAPARRYHGDALQRRGQNAEAHLDFAPLPRQLAAEAFAAAFYRQNGGWQVPAGGRDLNANARFKTQWKSVVEKAYKSTNTAPRGFEQCTLGDKESGRFRWDVKRTFLSTARAEPDTPAAVRDKLHLLGILAMLYERTTVVKAGVSYNPFFDEDAAIELVKEDEQDMSVVGITLRDVRVHKTVTNDVKKFTYTIAAALVGGGDDDEEEAASEDEEPADVNDDEVAGSNVEEAEASQDEASQDEAEASQDEASQEEAEASQDEELHGGMHMPPPLETEDVSDETRRQRDVSLHGTESGLAWPGREAGSINAYQRLPQLYVPLSTPEVAHALDASCAFFLRDAQPALQCRELASHSGDVSRRLQCALQGVAVRQRTVLVQWAWVEKFMAADDVAQRLASFSVVIAGDAAATAATATVVAAWAAIDLSALVWEHGAQRVSARGALLGAVFCAQRGQTLHVTFLGKAAAAEFSPGGVCPMLLCAALIEARNRDLVAVELLNKACDIRALAMLHYHFKFQRAFPARATSTGSPNQDALWALFDPAKPPGYTAATDQAAGGCVMGRPYPTMAAMQSVIARLARTLAATT